MELTGGESVGVWCSVVCWNYLHQLQRYNLLLQQIIELCGNEREQRNEGMMGEGKRSRDIHVVFLLEPR